MTEPKKPSSGRALKAAGIALLAIGAMLYFALGGAEESPAALLGALVMLGGPLLYFRGRQQAAKSIADSAANPLADGVADVLYLRSFQTDVSTFGKIFASGLSTEEEQLAKVLMPFGELVAIGQPGEPLPLPGATRIYASDSEWKRVVLEQMRAASLVVLRAGAGPGLLWEFEQVRSNRPPQTVLILVRGLTPLEYRAFAELMRDKLQLVLPQIGRCSFWRAVIDYRENPSKVLPGFMRFSSDWRPEFLPLPVTMIRFINHDSKRFRLALRPVFQMPIAARGRGA